MKAKHILGTVTIIAIVGGTIYAIKKSKDLQKQQEGEISLEEAMAEVKARREANDVPVVPVFTEEDMEDVRAEADFQASFTRPRVVKADDFEDEPEEEEEFVEYQPATKEDYPMKEVEEVKVMDQEVDMDTPFKEYWTEEDRTLRHDCNSQEALHQYIRMELAEWAPNEENYQTMVKLFNFPFNPENDGDWDLKTQIIDYRAQFFGLESKWCQQVTFAEVILHWAKGANYNMNESIRYWAEYVLQFVELDHRMPSHAIDEVIGQLNQHTYYNEHMNTFGLFGLTKGKMEDAIMVAERNIDKTLTYHIEFNEFLKTCF